jgi:hypothetical protein
MQHFLRADEDRRDGSNMILDHEFLMRQYTQESGTIATAKVPFVKYSLQSPAYVVRPSCFYYEINAEREIDGIRSSSG